MKLKLIIKTLMPVHIAMLATLAQGADSANGRLVFDRTCAACHQANGKGMAGLAPPLADTLGPLLNSEDGRRYIAQVMVHGLSGRIVSQGQTFNLAMPIQAELSDTDLSDVANYIAVELNGQIAVTFKPGDIASARLNKASHKEMRERRNRLLK